MSDTYYETPTEFMKRITDYHRQVFESEKKEIPGGDILPNSASWDIVRKSAIKAMNDIFSPFVEPMNQMNLVYSNPEGTSFRIAPIPGSFAYRRGVEKIIVSIDLRKNTNILSRVTSKDYIIEVSINDNYENYLQCDLLDYTRNHYIKIFDNPNFEDNINNVMSEVYRILTYEQVFVDNRCH